jgi:hypothetical protein
MEELISWEQKMEVCRNLSLVQRDLEDSHLRAVVILNISNLFFQREDYKSSHDTAQEAAHLIKNSDLSLEKVERRLLAMLPKAYYMMGLSRMLAGNPRDDEQKARKKRKINLEKSLEVFSAGLQVARIHFEGDQAQVESFTRMVQKVQGLIAKHDQRQRPTVVVRAPESKSEHESTGSRVSSQKKYRIKLQQVENSAKVDLMSKFNKMYSRAESHPLDKSGKIKDGEENSTSRIKKLSNGQARRVSQGPEVGTKLPANARIYSKREKFTDGDSLSINTNQLVTRAEGLEGVAKSNSALSEMDKLKSPTLSQGYQGADSTKDHLSKKENTRLISGDSKTKIKIGGKHLRGKDIPKYKKNMYRIHKPTNATENDRIIYNQLMQKIDDLQKVKESLGKNIKPFRQDHLMDHLKGAFSKAAEQNHHQIFVNLFQNLSMQTRPAQSTVSHPRSQNVSKNSGEETSRSKLSAEPCRKEHKSFNQIEGSAARKHLLLPNGIIADSTKTLTPPFIVDERDRQENSELLEDQKINTPV